MKQATRVRTEAERKVKLAAYIERVVSGSPPLCSAQRDKLALLLRGPRDDVDDVLDVESADDTLLEMMGEDG